MDKTNKVSLPIRIKIISLGNAEVGKSCVIKRYCEKRFVSKYLQTIGLDYGVTKVNVGNRAVKVNIFDLSGERLFYEIRNEFYKDTQGALLVYDVSDSKSFEALDLWLEEMRNEMGSPSSMDLVTVVLCGNKTDKHRVVDESDARLWAQSKGFRYFETSALTGDGINELFQYLFESVVAAAVSGSKPRLTADTHLGYTKEQAEAVQRLRKAKDNCERLGVPANATKDQINKSFRKLSVLLHPDKNIAPGSNEAFKLLVTARTELLKTANH